MIQINENDIKLLVSDVHNYIVSQCKNGKISLSHRLNLAECYLCFDELLKNNFLVSYERVILERDYQRIFNQVYDPGVIFYFSSFYYSYSNVKNGNEVEIQQQFQKMNLDIMAMFLNIKETIKKGYDLGYSEDDCFFSRIKNCNYAFIYILRHKLDNLYAVALYCICNLIQTLNLYATSQKRKFETETISNINILHTTLIDFLSVDEILEVVESNIQLTCFITDQLEACKTILNKQYSVHPKIRSLHDKNPKTVLRALTNLIHFDRKSFIDVFEKNYNKYIDNIASLSVLEKILLLRSTSIYLKEFSQFNCDVVLDLNEEMEFIDVSGILNKVFSIDQINIDNVSDTEVQLLYNLKDKELRKRFSKTMKGVDERILQREATKPHGSFEISDMEIPIEYNGKHLYLCMPFKSGVEIKGSSVPVDVIHQIIRPFTEFKNCVVVFVSAKRCSENLMNQIKKMRNMMNWPIAVIEEKTLAGLLSFNNQLSI